jgi:DNA-binding response OmpR family regulator
MALVLVADDDPDIRELVAFKLEQLGAETLSVEDGETALAMILSGIDVCRMIRADPEIAHTPVLMLTARVQEQDVERGFAVGADDYVTKPFSPRELMSRIQTLLSRVRT